MEKIKRQLHDIWKNGNVWKVQAEKGILTFKTKKAATKWVETLKKYEK